MALDHRIIGGLKQTSLQDNEKNALLRDARRLQNESQRQTNNFNALNNPVKLQQTQQQINNNALEAQNTQKTGVLKDQEILFNAAETIYGAVGDATPEQLVQNYDKLKPLLNSAGIDTQEGPLDEKGLAGLVKLQALGKMRATKGRERSPQQRYTNIQEGADGFVGLDTQSGQMVRIPGSAMPKPNQKSNEHGSINEFVAVQTTDGIKILNKLTGEVADTGYKSPAYDTDTQNKLAESKKSGANKAETMKQLSEWDSFKSGFSQAYPDVGKIIKDAPESSLSSATQKFIGKMIGNSTGPDAQAQIEQIGAVILGEIPFPPGAQSEKEMEQRKKTMGNIEDPNITPQTKLKMIARFLDFRERMFETKRTQVRNSNKRMVEQPDQEEAQSESQNNGVVHEVDY